MHPQFYLALCFPHIILPSDPGTTSISAPSGGEATGLYQHLAKQPCNSIGIPARGAPRSLKTQLGFLHGRVHIGTGFSSLQLT